MRQVDLVGLAMDATSGAPLVLLRELDEPHRLLPIFIGGPEAAAIAVAASGETPARPHTHDLMAEVIQRLDGHVDAVEVTELTDGAFRAVLALHGPTGDQRLDTRPSDAIALAVRLGAPLFVSEAVLAEAGTRPTDEVESANIDEAVEEFRSFLEEVEPSQFGEGLGDETAPPADDTDGTDPSGTAGDGS